MPRKGQRFLGLPDRRRLRVRRRRRQVFVILLDALGLSFLMGLFPPLRAMLYGAAFLAGLLVVYCLLLLRLRAVEVANARRRARIRRVAQVSAGPYAPAPVRAGHATGSNGNGHSDGRAVRNGEANGYAGARSVTNGHGDGYRHQDGRSPGIENGNGDARHVFDEVAILDEDVHVVVRRATAP